MEIALTLKNSPKLACIYCDYKCCKPSDMSKHKSTSKHHKKEMEYNNEIILMSDSNLTELFKCNCGKKYKHNSGLWKHKKICNFKEESIILNEKIEINNIVPDMNNITSELILNIIQQNQEFKDLLIEQNKIIIEISKNNNTTNINNTNNNSHNKTFNLQVFLNETCKDAMNIMDFADSIKLQLTDLENVGEYGFVNGISKIIIKSLQEMDINLRPVHCSDLKREVAYVRENGKWEKDTPDNKLIKKAIKRVAHRNIRQIPEWKKLYPDCIFSDSNKSDQYNELTIEAMGGRGDDDDGKANKIVKKIMKNVVIDKKMM
jgi:hypothetical protein